MIEVRGVHKSYGNTKALDGFSLVAEGGDLVGLVGPNGAGKTTLIKILATLVRADAGEIRVAGLDVGHEPSAVRQMTGYLPEVAGIYQEMRVAEFLGFFADQKLKKVQAAGGTVQTLCDAQDGRGGSWSAAESPHRVAVWTNSCICFGMRFI